VLEIVKKLLNDVVFFVQNRIDIIKRGFVLS